MGMRSIPTGFQKRTLWNAATGIAIGILFALFVGVIWLVGQVLGFLQPVLVPLAISGIIAYLLDPVVRWMQQRGFSRVGSIIIGYTLFLASIIGIGLTIFFASNFSDKPATFDQKPLTEKVVNSLERIGNRLQKAGEKTYIKPIVDWMLTDVSEETQSEPNKGNPPVTSSTNPQADNFAEEADILGPKPKTPFKDLRIGRFLTDKSDTIVNTVTKWISSSTNKALSVLGFLFSVALIPIYLYYFLKESDSIKRNWKDYVPLKASKFKDEVTETLMEINGYLISFFRGQVLVAFIDGILVGITLTIFQLPYGLLIGLVMAFLGIIPYIGNIICLVPACIIAYVHFDNPEAQHILGSNPWAYVGGVLAIFVIVQQINSLVTAPKIVGDSVGLHPMTVIFSMFFWTLILGGFLGALLAVPMTAAIKVLFRRYVWERKLNTTIDSRPSEEGLEAG